MKKIFLLLIVSFGFLFANGGINEKFIDPKSCQACHGEEYLMWKTSLHAKSHEKNNELFRQSVEFVSKELSRPYNQVLVACADCHNPRLEVKSLGVHYTVAEIFNIETKETKEAKEAIGAKHIQNGISCYICHNVDKLKEEKEIGYKNMIWTDGDEIVGPYDDEFDRAMPTHTSHSREFFKKGNDLCNSCHQGTTTLSELSLYNTGDEHALSGDPQRCVDCHMSHPRKAIIAPTTNPETAIKRDVRLHLFTGPRNSGAFLENSIVQDLNFTSKQSATLSVTNKISHNIPSGYSARSVEVSIRYLDATESEISKENLSFDKSFVNRRGFETLSYSATRLNHDTTLKAYETREINLNLPNGTKFVEVSMDYYVVKPKFQKILDVKGEEYTKPYFVSKVKYELK